MNNGLPIKKDFDVGFFEEETRNDFFISREMKKTWAIELDLLNKFSEICSKYNIKFFLFAGSLLGAVRHRGFIPWDDDLDIGMDRANYNKLLEVPQSEFEHPYFLQHALSDRKYFFGYARLRNSDTTGIIIDNKSKDYNNGIYVDIFVLDGYTQNERLLKKQLLGKRVCERLLYEYYVNVSTYSGIKKIGHMVLQSLDHYFFSYEVLVKKYNDILSCYTEKAEILALMTHPRSIFSRLRIEKKHINDLIIVDFENMKVPIPKETDCVLKLCYGDYMQFPPIEERGVWHEGILILDPNISYLDYIDNERND